MEHHLGLSGSISSSYDIDYESLTNAVNEVFRTNDLVNSNTGEIDPRHMYGMTNHDIFRWPSIEDGQIKSYLGTAILYLLLPGIPLVYYGEEQDMKLLDNTASNYICMSCINPGETRHLQAQSGDSQCLVALRGKHMAVTQ